MSARTQRLGVPGAAVLTVGLGAWLVYAGLRDVPVVDGLRDALSGSVPTSRVQPGDPQWRSLAAGTSSLLQAGATAVAGGGWDANLHPELARRLRAFTAANPGVQTPAGGGWRSNDRQRELRTINGCPDVDRSPASSCRVPTAIPGRSKHERTPAEAFDLEYATPAAQAWALLNASRFGLKFPIAREPWHVEMALTVGSVLPWGG